MVRVPAPACFGRCSGHPPRLDLTVRDFANRRSWPGGRQVFSRATIRASGWCPGPPCPLCPLCPLFSIQRSRRRRRSGSAGALEPAGGDPCAARCLRGRHFDRDGPPNAEPSGPFCLLGRHFDRDGSPPGWNVASVATRRAAGSKRRGGFAASSRKRAEQRSPRPRQIRARRVAPAPVRNTGTTPLARCVTLGLMSVLLLVGIGLVLLVMLVAAIAVAFVGGHREPPAPRVDEALADFVARSKAADREARGAKAPAAPPPATAPVSPGPVSPSPAPPPLAPSAAPSPPLTRERLTDLTRGELERRGLIAAIKLLREYSRQDLRTTKEAVEYLRTHGTLPADPRWGAGSDEPNPSWPQPAFAGERDPRVTPPSPELRAQAMDRLRAGRKIDAIRLVREHTGCGLKEAKDYVEGLE